MIMRFVKTENAGHHMVQQAFWMRRTYDFFQIYFIVPIFRFYEKQKRVLREKNLVTICVVWTKENSRISLVGYNKIPAKEKNRDEINLEKENALKLYFFFFLKC